VTVTKAQLDNFHKFATAQLDSGVEELSWSSIFDLWQLQNPTTDERADIETALEQSLSDIRQGRTRPASEFISELREKYELNS